MAAVGLARVGVVTVLRGHLALGVLLAQLPVYFVLDVAVVRLCAGALAGERAAAIGQARQPRVTRGAGHQAAAAVGRGATLLRGAGLLHSQRHAATARPGSTRATLAAGPTGSAATAALARLAAVARAEAGPVLVAHLAALTGTGADAGHRHAGGAEGRRARATTLTGATEDHAARARLYPASTCAALCPAGPGSSLTGDRGGEAIAVVRATRHHHRHQRQYPEPHGGRVARGRGGWRVGANWRSW